MIIPMTEGGQTENTWDEAEDVAQAKALRIWRAILIAALVIAAITYLSSNVVPNVFPKRFDTVAKGQVYRSGKLTPRAMTSRRSSILEPSRPGRSRTAAPRRRPSRWASRATVCSSGAMRQATPTPTSTPCA
jgi:hypothetical protein